ncbi:MAG TPA: flagellar biosynthesis anti-sigma factor FlgM [Conexibacter sp.]
MVATNDRIHRITTARRDRITRSSRVRLLARQVAAGEYEVDTDALAEALVRRMLFHRGVCEELIAESAARKGA